MLLLLHLDKEQPTCPKFQQTGLYILDLKCHIRTEVNKVLASAFPSQDKDSIASSLKFNISSKYIYIYITNFPCSYLIFVYIANHSLLFSFTILLPSLFLCRKKQFLQLVYTVWVLLREYSTSKQTLLKQHSPLVWMQFRSLISMQL